MIAHPFVLICAAVDVAALVLLAWASVTAGRVVLKWDPGSATRAQLMIESGFETASLLARWGGRLFAAGSVLFLLAISSVLPAVVPGAMCGAGVLVATGGLGTRAILARMMALGALGVWHVIDRLDRQYPLSPLARPSAKALLLALPLVLLAVIQALGALGRINPELPTSCCALIYQRARGVALGGPLPIATAVVVTFGGALLVVGTGGGLARGNPRFLPGAARVAAVAALVWSVAATVALKGEFAAYHYGVLGHDCIWCLFLTEHWAVGFPIFGALAWTAFEGLTSVLVVELAQRFPSVGESAERRARKAGRRMIAGVALYALLAVLPAALYRLRWGVWLHGGP